MSSEELAVDLGDASLLVAILDLNPEMWKINEDRGGLKLSDVLLQAFSFFKAMMLQNGGNRLCLIVHSRGKRAFAYPSVKDHENNLAVNLSKAKKRVTRTALQLEKLPLEDGQMNDEDHDQSDDDNIGNGDGDHNDHEGDLSDKTGDIARSGRLKMNGSGERQAIPSSSLSSVLSMALCFINKTFVPYESIIRQIQNSSQSADRLSSAPSSFSSSSLSSATSGVAIHPSMRRKEDQKVKIVLKSPIQARILVFQISDDDPIQHIPIMNAAFSAKKLDVVIDAIHFGSDSSFLKMATAMAGGTSLHLIPTANVENSQSNLFAALLMVFSMDKKLRGSIKTIPSSSESVEYQSACFCHKRIISIGFVCSVCLAVYCETRKSCSICNTNFFTEYSSMSK